jgi:hypothetical protein
MRRNRPRYRTSKRIRLQQCSASRISLEKPCSKNSVSFPAFVTVSARYDMFRLDGEGPLWFAAVETMQEANAKAAQLTDCPACLVLDSVTGEKITLKVGQSASQQKP